MAAAVAAAGRRRLSVSAHLRRLRQHQPALVAGRPARSRSSPIAPATPRSGWSTRVPGAQRPMQIAERRYLQPHDELHARRWWTRPGTTLPARVSISDSRGCMRTRRTTRGSTPTICSCRSGRRSRRGTSTAAGQSRISVPLDRADDHRQSRSGVRDRAPRRRSARRGLVGSNDRDAEASSAPARRAGMVERRPPRAHELRRHIPQHAATPGRAGARRGSQSRLQPDRQQGAAVSGHRELSAGSRSRIDWRSARSCTDRNSTPATGGISAILNLTQHLLLPGYAGYPFTAAASPYPHNAPVADMAHEQQALVGYAHPFDEDVDPAARCADERTAGRCGARQGGLLRGGRLLRSQGDRTRSGIGCSSAACRFPPAPAPTRWRTTRACADRSA